MRTRVAAMRRVEAGAELKARREEQGLTLREVAYRIDYNPGMLSMWERGLRTMDTWEAALYLGACVTPMREALRIISLVQPPSDLYWVRPYFDRLEDPVKSVIIQENLAKTMICYNPDYIPGLHQTEDYARIVFGYQPHHSPEEVNFLVNARLDRQKLLQRPKPPHCVFFIHEDALRKVVGHPQTTYDQLQYLLLSASLPHCSIRVVPEASPAGRARRFPFRIMEFPEPRPAMAYAEIDTANLFIEDRPAVETYYALVTQLEQSALDEGQSRDWLIRLADEYERMKE
ncbi:helix-turn-helix transcriptional regulator [Amycolatopsis sp. NPDC059021]|uniref:helix-turn-helix domain-containing protein n=1 Tax=Amycolatopsis sp. NPDC059021 TaxID=3346704 RepID=UPI003671BF7B